MTFSLQQQQPQQNRLKEDITVTQRGGKLLNYLGHLYHKNKNLGFSANGKILVLWECERRRDLRYSVYVTTDEDGSIIKDVTRVHVHAMPAAERAAMLQVRHTILEEAARRPEAAPTALLNETVTTTVALHLPGECSLKRVIQRMRNSLMPRDPVPAADIVLPEAWKMTLAGRDWYLGDTVVGNDHSHIFSTENNSGK